MDKMAPIGVIDSGVGGLSVLKCLYRALPHEDFVYLGDTAMTPYGTRAEKEIRELTLEGIGWLGRRGVKLVVLACNTITSLGTESLKKGFTFNIIGMSKGEKLVLSASRNKKIGVLATDFTVSTGAHKKAILALDGDALVFAKGCPKFVTLIEEEKFATPEMEAAIREYTADFINEGVDTVILSCTHFPFIEDEMAAILGGIKIIDPAEKTASDAAEDLERSGLLREEGSGTVRICCTADLKRVWRLAARMIPTEDCSFEEVDLKG
ncbi:MAG: glutamate racemase [Phascolarctobacterium sp.]|nr:glutamate racemase [Phascolarctobacterium sp.]